MKSIGAHNQVTSGWVQEVLIFQPPKTSDTANIVVSAKVCRSTPSSHSMGSPLSSYTFLSSNSIKVWVNKVCNPPSHPPPPLTTHTLLFLPRFVPYTDSNVQPPWVQTAVQHSLVDLFGFFFFFCRLIKPP